MVFGFQAPYARAGGRPFFVTEHVQSLANIEFKVPPQTDPAEDDKKPRELVWAFHGGAIHNLYVLPFPITFLFGVS